MTIAELRKIIQTQLKYILLFPFLLSLVVLAFTTRTEKQYKSSGIVYTGLASGYNITSEEGSNLDFFAVNNAFDNLISTVNSRETLEETAIRLLAYHLHVNKPSRAVISEENFKELHKLFSPEFIRKVRGGSIEETYNNLNAYKHANLKNEITDVLNATHGNYSIQHLANNLRATRKSSSDMLELSFTSDDPAISKMTLTILIDVFIGRYKDMKGREANNVVAWFEDQLKAARKKLTTAEEKLKQFGVDNKIINYYEQTKVIAEAKEEAMRERETERNRIAEAKANRQALEDRMKHKRHIYKLNDEINRERKMLSDLQYKIANAEILGVDREKISDLRTTAEQLKNSINSKLSELHEINNDPSGVPRESLMKNWLDNNLAAEGGGSKLDVIQSRLNTFDEVYNKYAPLGAVLKGLERDVEVAEKEYLAALNGLNQARLRRQNIEMSNNISTLDTPFFPLKPQPSKRLLLVMLTFVLGTVVSFSYFIIRHLMDNTIRNVENAARCTTNEVLAALPDFNHQDVASFQETKESIFNHVLGSLSLKFLSYKLNAKKPKYINLYSHNTGEGVAWFSGELARHLRSLGNEVFIFYPETSSLAEKVNLEVGVPAGKYPIGKDFLFVNKLQELIHEPFDPDRYDYILNVFPPFKDHQVPARVLESGDLNIMVLDARRVWTPFDQYLNDLCKNSVPVPPLVVLNRIDYYHLKAIYGNLGRDKGLQPAPARSLLARMKWQAT